MENNTFNLVKEEIQKNLHSVFELAWHNEMYEMIDWIVNNCTIESGVIRPRMADNLEHAASWENPKEDSKEKARKVSAQKVIEWAGLYHYAALCEVYTRNNWPKAKEIVKRFPEILNLDINEGYRSGKSSLLNSFASNATEFYSVVTKYENYIDPKVYADTVFSLGSVATIKKALRLKKELFMKCLDLPCGRGEVPFKANLLKYGITKINNEKITISTDDYFKLVKSESRLYSGKAKKEVMDKIPSYINDLDKIKGVKDCIRLFRVAYNCMGNSYRPFHKENIAATEYYIIQSLVPIAQQSSCSIVLTDFIELVIKKIEKRMAKGESRSYPYRSINDEELKELKNSLSKRKLIEMIRE